MQYDSEVPGRAFNLLRFPEYVAHIGPPCDRWLHLKGQCDLPRLFRIHYRDWFLRNQLPARTIADGCLYIRKEHRDELYGAFSQVGWLRWKYAFVWLWPENKDERFRRYRKAVEQRSPEAIDWEDARWRSAFRDHSECTFKHLEFPDGEEPVVSVWVQSIEELRAFLEAWSSGAVIDGFTQPPDKGRLIQSLDE